MLPSRSVRWSNSQHEAKRKPDTNPSGDSLLLLFWDCSFSYLTFFSLWKFGINLRTALLRVWTSSARGRPLVLLAILIFGHSRTYYNDDRPHCLAAQWFWRLTCLWWCLVVVSTTATGTREGISLIHSHYDYCWYCSCDDAAKAIQAIVWNPLCNFECTLHIRFCLTSLLYTSLPHW